MNRSIITAMVLLGLAFLLPGCRRAAPEAEPNAAADSESEAATASQQEPATSEGPATNEPPADRSATAEIEVSAEALRAQRRPIEAAREGWIRLFDGQTLFGWENA